MDPVSFQVGPVSRVAAGLVAGGSALYTLATAYYTARAFQKGLEDRWSAALATAVMGLLAALFAQQGASLLPAPFSIAVLLFMVGGIAFTLTYTLGRFQDRIDRFREEFGARLLEVLEQAVPEERREALERVFAGRRADLESRRKAPHLLMGLFLVFYLGVGFLVLRGFWDVAYGGTGAGAGEGVQNLFVATHAADGTWLVAGHLFSVTLLLCLLFLILPNELLRLKVPELSYPFKATILERLRDKEAGLFGAHYYITATLPLAILWVARDPATWDAAIPAVLALLAVTVFADSASALVGQRFGRTPWFHNPGKTYMGTLGGTAVAFLVAWPFVGVPVAVASAAVFLFMDVVGPVPVPVSDNILNPVGLAAAYTFLLGAVDPVLPFY